MTRTWFSAVPAGNGVADIAIYDDIGSWGVSAKDFRNALAGLGPVDTINLRLNSGGGDASQAIAIHNMLARHPAKVNVTVDGMAASGASFIAMAGEVTMPENATMFVHNPWGAVVGDAEAMIEEAGWLQKLSQSMAATYARKTGKTPEQMLAVMDANTWMTAQEAKDQGFADVVAAPSQIVAHFDPKRLAPPDKIATNMRAAYDPDGDGDDDAMEAVGYIGVAIASLTDAVGCLTGTGDSDDVGEQSPMMAAVKAAAAKTAKAAQSPALKPGGVIDIAADVGDPREEAAQIVAACVMAKRPDLAAGYITSGKSYGDVCAALLILRAAPGDRSDEISTRHNSFAGAETVSWQKTIDRINARDRR